MLVSIEEKQRGKGREKEGEGRGREGEGGGRRGKEKETNEKVEISRKNT